MRCRVWGAVALVWLGCAEPAPPDPAPVAAAPEGAFIEWPAEFVRDMAASETVALTGVYKGAGKALCAALSARSPDAVLATLSGAEAPEGAVAVFSFGAIPDDLKEEFLAGIVAALGTDAPIHVLLVGVKRFRTSARGGSLDARHLAWTALSERAGVAGERVHLDEEAT